MLEEMTPVTPVQAPHVPSQDSTCEPAGVRLGQSPSRPPLSRPAFQPLQSHVIENNMDLNSYCLDLPLPSFHPQSSRGSKRCEQFVRLGLCHSHWAHGLQGVAVAKEEANHLGGTEPVFMGHYPRSASHFRLEMIISSRRVVWFAHVCFPLLFLKQK